MATRPRTLLPNAGGEGAREELCEARSVATESAARADALEEKLAMADERARRAQDDYRLMLEQRAALSVDEASHTS